jgi:RNA polymerase sigma-70 factor (ECF subfamily)
MKLLDKTDVFVSEEAQKAWLIRVAINESKNLLKSVWFRKRSDLDESLVAAERNSDTGFFEYVKKLKPKYRTVIYLHYFEGYSTKEIATILKMTQTGVTTQLNRARKQLKEDLIKEGTYYDKLQSFV